MSKIKTGLEPKKIVVEVRKWHDRVNGNTYHGVKFFINDKKFMLNFVYGYGEQYRKTVKDLLKKDGITEINDIKIESMEFMRNFYFNIDDNCKKRDLTGWE